MGGYSRLMGAAGPFELVSGRNIIAADDAPSPVVERHFAGDEPIASAGALSD
jgi:hypothetical protein